MPVQSRYVGESNAYDVANNITYMGDMIYYNPGDNFTNWTAGGSTAATISTDAQFDLYDNTNAANQTSYAYMIMPSWTLGPFFTVFHFVVTRQADDTSTDDIAFYATLQANLGTLSIPRGFNLRYRAGTNQIDFGLAEGLGSTSIYEQISYTFNVNQEVSVDMVMTPKKLVLLMDNVKEAEVLLRNSTTQLQDFFSDEKKLYFFARHDATEVSHFKVRDIRVARYVGQGDLE